MSGQMILKSLQSFAPTIPAGMFLLNECSPAHKFDQRKHCLEFQLKKWHSVLFWHSVWHSVTVAVDSCLK